MKQITIDEVPRQVADAAAQVEEYFASRGILAWGLGGLQSRVKSAPTATVESRVVDATAAQLVRAVMSRDHPPVTAEAGIHASAMHLGLCCLGGRTVRLELPNGRHLRVVLE